MYRICAVSLSNRFSREISVIHGAFFIHILPYRLLAGLNFLLNSLIGKILGKNPESITAIGSFRIIPESDVRLGRLSGRGAFEVLVGARRAFGALVEVCRAFGEFARSAVRSRHLSESARLGRLSRLVVHSGYARLGGRSAEGRADLLLGRMRKGRWNQFKLRVRAWMGAMSRSVREIFF